MTKECGTAIVYAVSPDRSDQLFLSIDSLLSSGSQFDLVRICCVGTATPKWRFTDPRIRVEHCKPLFGSYFYGNKLYLCDTRAKRVVFLDADTLVLRPLAMLWHGRKESFLARPGSAMNRSSWRHGVWRRLFLDSGKEEIPMFNAGVLVFQQDSHYRLKNRWQTLLRSFMTGTLPAPYHDRRMLEQWSLSLAVAQEGISFAELGPESHAFGWQHERPEGATVFHYGHGHCDELPMLLRDGVRDTQLPIPPPVFRNLRPKQDALGKKR